MIVTEEAARTRWCPHARVIFNAPNSGISDVNGEKIRVAPPTHAATAYNRATDGQVPASTCMASGCMAWEWAESAKHGAKRRGYCGLMGSSKALESWIRSEEREGETVPATTSETITFTANPPSLDIKAAAARAALRKQKSTPNGKADRKDA